MSTILAKVKRLTAATEAGLSLIAKQWGFGTDTRRITVMDSDGVTKRYFWDSTRLADQTATYGTALIGTQGITGVTPSGGSSGAAGTLQAMLGGLSDKIIAGISGTTGTIPKITGTQTLGDSILSESGGSVALSYGQNGTSGFFSQNTTSGTESTATYSLTSNGGLGASIYLASSAYTTETLAASRLNILCGSIGTGVNLGGRNATDTVKTYFGTTMSSTTVFHTLSNKGMKLENLVLSTDADGIVAGINQTLTLSKADANTRQFYSTKSVTTINTAGNSNTTLDLIHYDTVNTNTTGVTTNLINLKYGGTQRFKVGSEGNTYIYGNLGVGNVSSDAKIYVEGGEGTGDIELDAGSLDPTPTASAASAKVYYRSNKLIVVINDAGTVRYKYLDLSGTGVTWVHSTSAP